MTKAVAKAVPNMEVQVRQAIDWLENVPALLEQADSPEAVADLMKKVEFLHMAAEKTRMTEILQQAAEKELRVKRKLGQLLGQGKRGRPAHGEAQWDYEKAGLNKTDVFRIRRLGEMPEFVFETAISGASTASIHKCLKEYERYISLKKVTDEAGLKNAGAKLKNMIDEGWTPLQARQELLNEDDADEVDIFSDDDEDEEDDVDQDDGLLTEMREFETNAQGFETLKEWLEETFEDAERIDPSAWLVGSQALKKILKVAKEMKDLFANAKGLVKEDEQDD